MTNLKTLTTVAIWMAVSTAASQAVIVNGNFDTFVPSSDTGGGWTTTQIDQNGGWLFLSGDHGHVFSLNDNGNASTDPMIAQTVKLSIGSTYRVEGDFSSYYHGYHENYGFAAGYNNMLGFEAGPTSVGIYNIPPEDISWKHFAFDFVPTGTSVIIWMKGECRNTDNDFLVDNVTVTAVPEPSTYLAGLSSLGMLGMAAWRNRK